MGMETMTGYFKNEEVGGKLITTEYPFLACFSEQESGEMGWPGGT